MTSPSFIDCMKTFKYLVQSVPKELYDEIYN